MPKCVCIVTGYIAMDTLISFYKDNRGRIDIKRTLDYIMAYTYEKIIIPIDWRMLSYSSALNCYHSLNEGIKKYGYSDTIACVCRDDKVYLSKGV